MNSRPSLILRNVTLPSGRTADVSLCAGKVIHVGAPSISGTGIDCAGMIALPAAIDMHVHMRGGQQSEKEDWGTGSKSALAGGVTVVVDQPNTLPPIDTPGRFLCRVGDAKKHSLCNFAVNSAVTPDVPFEAMERAGAMAYGETFFAPSSYGDAVAGEALELSLGRIHGFGGLATIHAEEISPGPDCDLIAHDAVRSPDGEVRAVDAVQRLNASGCRLHFCHISSARSIGVAKGTVEVTPHHLFLSREDFGHDDPLGKVNPPLRSRQEREELFRQWDRIDVIASDHAPHTRVEKSQDFSVAPSGLPGVETMVPLLMAKVMEKTISLDSVILKTSHSPAEILGIPPAGFRVGNRADFALYPCEPCRIRAEILHSKCGWTPYEGHMAVFPKIVIMNGEVVYNDGDFFPVDPLWFPGKGFTGTP